MAPSRLPQRHKMPRLFRASAGLGKSASWAALAPRPYLGLLLWTQAELLWLRKELSLTKLELAQA
eukprot:scaffold84551_cov75-Phaeocystis_antarctica.AAC.1